MVWRPVFQILPSLLHSLTHECLIRGVVYSENNSLKLHEIEYFVDLENTARVLPAKAAQIHEHRVAFIGQPRQSDLPGIVVTEKFANAKFSVAVGRQIHFIDTQVESSTGIDKSPG